MKGWAVPFVFLFFCSCSEKNPPNKFENEVLVLIADDQDRRLSDSLYRYFNSPNPQYRSEAALAFGSLRDTAASPLLGNLLLEDPDAQVRRNAAFALGQTGGVAAVNALIPSLVDRENSVVSKALEALGKTIRKDDIETLKNYHPVDSLTQEGLVWAFYRLGVRGLADSAIIIKVAEFLRPQYILQVRLGAANFFNRAILAKNNFANALSNTALSDPSAEVRMAAVSGLRKYKSDSVLQVLKKILEKEKDYRVRVSLARTLQSFDLDQTKPLFLSLLKDQNSSVGIAASESLVNVFLKAQWNEILQVARLATNWRIQANLYKAFLTNSPTHEVVEEVRSRYFASKSNYQKASLLGALSKANESYGFIRDELMRTNSFVIRSSAAEALVVINHSKKFSQKLQSEFVEIYKQAITAGDPAVTGIICSALADPGLGYKAALHNFHFLYEARKKMKMPEDIESLQPLEYAIAYLEGKPKPPPLKNQYNHPIDWNLVRSIPKNQRVSVKTTQGEIVLRLFVEEAPGSVANFIDLVNRKYFNQKFFHRVVPNFVIQAGCRRGDGFGSEDYSIRSEFSTRRYTTGSVGMASAGKDTEGTQWFITHSPTPHLDGNYTIFAEVVKGMEVVNRIEVGDQILTVSLLNN